MGALTPEILMDLESRMQVLTEREYKGLLSNLWWKQITSIKTGESRRQVFTWLLSTAMIREQGEGGNKRFDDLVSQYTEAEAKDAGAALELRKNQLEDTDGGGMDLAGQWSADIGAYMAYWPQKRVTYFLKNAHTASIFTGYDGKAFFATDHPVNPAKSGSATFANVFTGAASGSYPGALPIDDTIDDDDALNNLTKMFAYIASILMPNGEDPRFLRPGPILCGPRMYPRVCQLTSAKFIAKVAGSGAGSADVESMIKMMGYAQPTLCDELAGFESDTTYFVGARQISASQLGAVVYYDREPFRINYYGNVDQAELNRKRTLEWHADGRNSVSAGHPFLLFKGKGS